jgi:hypothetical protein
MMRKIHSAHAEKDEENMYGQFQNSTASAAKWFVIAFFGVVAMAILLGANLKDAKWINPNIADSEAYRIRVEAEHQRAMDELEQQRVAAQTEAEIQEIQRQQALADAQYQHDIQALDQDLQHQDLAFRTWMTIFTIVASTFSLTLLLATTIWAGSRARVYVQSNLAKEVPMAKHVPHVEYQIPNLPERDMYDPWADPNYRRRMKKAAKSKEQKERGEQLEADLLAVRVKYVSDPAKISGDERNKLPLAGD